MVGAALLASNSTPQACPTEYIQLALTRHSETNKPLDSGERPTRTLEYIGAAIRFVGVAFTLPPLAAQCAARPWLAGVMVSPETYRE
jgi:hypothetical protein